ncbi:MAG TPA: ATP-binding protein [Mycobacteriales bacterium]
MATVTLRLAPRPAHVRTARLVASAMARRSGVDEVLLDDVRLAVGEACARAVRLHQRHRLDDPVTLELSDGEHFSVVVTDVVVTDGVTADGVTSVITGAVAERTAATASDRTDLVVTLTGAPEPCGVPGPTHGAGVPVIGEVRRSGGPVTAGVVGLAGPPGEQDARITDPLDDALSEALDGSVALVGTPEWIRSERLGLAVLAGVVDDLRVERGAEGTTVRMRWPVGD